MERTRRIVFKAGRAARKAQGAAHDKLETGAPNVIQAYEAKKRFAHGGEGGGRLSLARNARSGWVGWTTSHIPVAT